MGDFHLDSLRQNKLEVKRVRIFHGISPNQRSGEDPLKTLVNIIDTGVIYPVARGGSEGFILNELDKLELVVLRHALKNKIWKGRLDLDQYLENNLEDEDFVHNPMIEKYLNDDNYRNRLKKASLNIFDIDYLIRQKATWTQLDERETIKTYGNDVYLEIEENSEDVITGIEEGMVAVVVGPIELHKIKRIVLSSKYEKELEDIKNRLKEKGLNNIIVEVGEHV